MSNEPKSGVVHLVGAGPGDPALITVRGKALLEQADVVVYDYLASPQLLTHCPNAQVIYVGKQAAKHSMTQDQINDLLVAQARLGKRVVRLKGGDPFVFGRGGEEAEALVAAGVRFEVVPGITAAIGSSAYAGIPVTHRDLNSSFTLVTGHEKEADYQEPAARRRPQGQGASDIDWSILAKLPCLAFYMGVKALPRICANLMAHGMPADMPAAVIQWGTTIRQRTVTGTLDDLAAKVAAARITPPALILVGRVVGLRQMLNWFETRPLYGQNVLVTRTRQQASDLAAQLAELGAHVLEAPTIELAPPRDYSAIDEALQTAGDFDWVIFTSVNGVNHTRSRLLQIGLDARAFGSARVAAIGQATAQAVDQQLCLRVDLCPQKFVAEALTEELERCDAVLANRFLLLRAEIGREVLVQRLRDGGAAEVRDVGLYETRPAASLPQPVAELLDQKALHWVTFTSGSTVRYFVDLLGPRYRARLAGTRLASIGPVTSRALRELGLEPTVEAKEASIAGLVQAIQHAAPR